MAGAATSDVLIMGGGLAGLTLALQLRARLPGLPIRVLERRAGPAPPAAFKVGESTVEIGAHYFANVLGLREHLDAAQVRKFGFRFFFSDGRESLDGACELGVSRVFPTPSWQIERGTFENYLCERARQHDIGLETDCCVRSVSVGHDGAPHAVDARSGTGTRKYRARWLIDASGRAGLLRRQLGLGEDNGHRIGAAWFRVDARLALDDWCHNPAWRGRCEPPERWRSTNHLCGPGYWVWLIPLASGAHSVGIVADPTVHPVDSFNTHARALAWLRRHQPVLAERLDRYRDAPLDFRFLRDVSYGCRQLFSGDRWALTGEAGLFPDPFYSPGSDIIAIGNTCITELVARDLAGGDIAASACHYQQLLLSFHRNMLNLYRGQYALFGDAQVMTTKVLWDYTYYWGVLCPLVIGGRLADVALFADLREELAGAEDLNLRVQAFFRTWHAHDKRGAMPDWMDQQQLAWFARLNARLHDPLDDASVRPRLRENIGLLHALAGAIGANARAADHSLDISALPRDGIPHERPALFECAA